MFLRLGVRTFRAGPIPVPIRAATDPSATFGQSGNFYLSALGFPAGTAPPGGAAGCAQSVFVSSNQGTTFAFKGNAAFCPLTAASGSSLCLPDQPFLAADSINAAIPGGSDQLYAVWRNFTPAWSLFGGPAACTGVLIGPETPMLSCSVNGGLGWSSPIVIGPGDSPRITVGSDGSLYVVLRDDKDVMLYKYGSCATGLALVPGFPVVVDTSTDPVRPLAGLDRTDPQTLSNATVAVDDTNPLHVYVAYAQSYLGSDNIIVQQSTNGGLTFTSVGAANTSVTARRFMPWACSTKGIAFVSWYDRRSASRGHQ